MEQGGGHAGIHAAGQPENDVFLADLRANVFHGLIDVAAHGPLAAAAADLVNEVADNRFALGRVNHLGVKL